MLFNDLFKYKILFYLLNSNLCGILMIFQIDFIIIIVSYIILLLFLALTLGFFAYFLKKYLVTRHKMFRYLIILFFTFLFRNVFQFGVLIFNSTEYVIPCFILREIFDMLMLYSLVVLLEVFEKDVSFSTRQLIMTILVFMAIGRKSPFSFRMSVFHQG